MLSPPSVPQVRDQVFDKRCSHLLQFHDFGASFLHLSVAKTNEQNRKELLHIFTECFVELCSFSLLGRLYLIHYRAVIIICVDYTPNFTSKVCCILLFGDHMSFLIKLSNTYFKTVIQNLSVTVHSTQLSYSPFCLVLCYLHHSCF